MENWKTITDRWELLDNAPEFAKNTASLIRWSSNYNAGDTASPIIPFLALIGYFDDVIGVEKVEISRTGAVEMSYLGDALNEYADRPIDVWDFVERYFVLETEG
jgi:hypothetical protein